MYIRRHPRRNLFVEQKEVRRRRVKRFSVVVILAAVILFFSMGGVDEPVRSNTSPNSASRIEADTGNAKDNVMVASVGAPEDDATRKSPGSLPEPEEASQRGNEPKPAVEFVGPPSPPEPKIEVLEGRIESGQTASALLDSWLSAREIYDADRKCREVYALSRLKAGRPYSLEIEDGDFKSFVYEIDNERMLVLSRTRDGFEAKREAIEYDTETVIVHGDIDSSLFEAVSDAGEHPSLAVRLSEIFAWDIDFVRDIRTGDSFRVVVEKRYRDGEFAGYGTIPAAMFVNRRQEFKGFRYAVRDGRPEYFDEKGRSLRKTFLKAPLSFTRISSGYSMNRLHPVLKIRRPHQGIDYAAPRGTPVKAVGDGVVIKAAWDRGGGRFVKVRHNSVYETTYMHLSRFARGVKRGKRVSQGQVIGFVGSTGLSTGPHLDFRMKKNGGYVNPRRIKSPPCKPIPEDMMNDYLASIAEVRAKLESGGLMHAEAAADLETIVQ
jgi:murein DD-endopeptidase MepM/ murein hydrolase activator NlpD